MSVKNEILRRPLSYKGQLCVPHEWREGVEAYMVTIAEESTDKNGAPVLTLYPVQDIEDTTQD